MRYIAELDGLRSVAILSVMVFHLGLLPIGWIGVPLFFVLSGYLITRILIVEREKPLTDYLARFFWRRTIRIFPLYYAYLALNAALVVALGLSLEGYGWFIAYLGNYQIAAAGSNLQGGVIAHLWSLAVEEQFYLIWPLAVFFSRRIWPWALAAIVAAPVFRESILATTGNPYLAIVALPGCMDLLAAGALVAVTQDRRILWIMAGVGSMIIGWCFSEVPLQNFGETALWVPQAHILYTGLALVFGPLMILAPKLSALNLPPLVWIGKISYGLYIWHMLAFAIAKRLPVPFEIQAVGGICLAFIIAATSWYAFEKPILRLKDGYPMRMPVIPTNRTD